MSNHRTLLRSRGFARVGEIVLAPHRASGLEYIGDELPSTSGVYTFLMRWKAMLVGKAGNLNNRVRSYVRPANATQRPRIAQSICELLASGERVEVFVLTSTKATTCCGFAIAWAQLVPAIEAHLIHTLCPPWNDSMNHKPSEVVRELRRLKAIPHAARLGLPQAGLTIPGGTINGTIAASLDS